MIFHPKKEQEVVGSKCKACQKTFYGKNSTNLKAHLEKFHPDSFKVIKSKWVYFVLFCIWFAYLHIRSRSNFSAEGYGIYPGSVEQSDRRIKCFDHSSQVCVLLLSLLGLFECLWEEKSQQGKNFELYYDIARDSLNNLGWGLDGRAAGEIWQVPGPVDRRLHFACLGCPGPQYGEICGLSQSSRESPLQMEAPGADKDSLRQEPRKDKRGSQYSSPGLCHYRYLEFKALHGLLYWCHLSFHQSSDKKTAVAYN